MKIVGAIREAIVGWRMILTNHAGWREHFRLSAAGLATGLAVFYLFAFLAVVLASFGAGVPDLPGFILVMAVQSLWLVALLIGIFGTRAVLHDKSPVLPLLVPGTYALVAYLVLGTLLSLTLGALLPLLWLALLYMFFQLGRAAAGWSFGIAAAFAALTVVLLVGMPMTLYMLATALPAPA
jgi:hypothetical protein